MSDKETCEECYNWLNGDGCCVANSLIHKGYKDKGIEIMKSGISGNCPFFISIDYIREVDKELEMDDND